MGRVGGMICVQYILWFANVSFLSLSIIVLSVGIIHMITFNSYITFLSGQYFMNAVMMSFTGVFLFFIALFGFSAAAKESILLLKVYTILVLILILVEISVGLTASILRPNVSENIKHSMLHSLSNYTEDRSRKRAWDFIQKSLHCCGAEHPRDWAPHNIRGYPVNIDGQIFSIPFSCCESTARFCNGIFKRGCADALESYAYDSSKGLGYVAISISIVEFLGVIIAYLLAKAIHRAEYDQQAEWDGLARESLRGDSGESGNLDNGGKSGELEHNPVPSVSNFPGPSGSNV